MNEPEKRVAPPTLILRLEKEESVAPTGKKLGSRDKVLTVLSISTVVQIANFQGGVITLVQPSGQHYGPFPHPILSRDKIGRITLT